MTRRFLTLFFGNLSFWEIWVWRGRSVHGFQIILAQSHNSNGMEIRLFKPWRSISLLCFVGLHEQGTLRLRPSTITSSKGVFLDKLSLPRIWSWGLLELFHLFWLFNQNCSCSDTSTVDASFAREITVFFFGWVFVGYYVCCAPERCFH